MPFSTNWRHAAGSAYAAKARATNEIQLEYLRTASDPANIHAMCEDYRASASIDLTYDEADMHKKIACPLLVLWGEKGAYPDLYDVLAELSYGVPARSRAERAAAFPYKNKSWLREMPENTAQTLTALARQFERGGIEELEAETVFDAAEVAAAGGLRALRGSGAQPADLLDETKRKLLAA